MAKEKYKIKPGHENEQVIAKHPPDRGHGLYILGECNQKELKYLYDIVKYPAIIFESDDEKNKTEEQNEGGASAEQD